MKQRLWILILMMTTQTVLTASAQHVVVADAVTYEPVAHASLFSRDGGGFRSVVTNPEGEATVPFTFSRLTVTHLNYHSRKVTRLTDTLFLQPKAYQIRQVTVSNREPAWIRPLLRRFVKEKDGKYFPRPMMLQCGYVSQSIAGRRYYRYDAMGLLSATPSFWYLPLTGTVTTEDSLRLTDVTSLRRMLYEDFVRCFDKPFINGHRFDVNPEYKGRPGEVELFFWTKDRVQGDHGHFVIDTTRLVITEATRSAGLRYNQRTKISAMLLSLEWMLSGYKIRQWTVDQHTVYRAMGGAWYPAESAYKFFYRATERRHDVSDDDYNQATGGGFTNMESTLYLSPPDSLLTACAAVGHPLLSSRDSLRSSLRQAQQGDTLQPWQPLPPAWYIRYATDADRRQEVRLARLQPVLTDSPQRK